MDLKQLEYFTAIADEGNVSAAARRHGHSSLSRISRRTVYRPVYSPGTLRRSFDPGSLCLGQRYRTLAAAGGSVRNSHLSYCRRRNAQTPRHMPATYTASTTKMTRIPMQETISAKEKF